MAKVGTDELIPRRSQHGVNHPSAKRPMNSDDHPSRRRLQLRSTGLRRRRCLRGSCGSGQFFLLVGIFLWTLVDSRDNRVRTLTGAPESLAAMKADEKTTLLSCAGQYKDPWLRITNDREGDEDLMQPVRSGSFGVFLVSGPSGAREHQNRFTRGRLLGVVVVH